ncbi:hypothetical protein K9K85_00040 [Patescibacteria group bacterium]|nr:hypothetical protein [Patescibacteria group bacterium]
MAETKTLIFSEKKQIAWEFMTLLSITIVAPLFHQQIITGSLVNAALFITTARLGKSWGILLATIPSLIALTTGLLPLALAPFIPYIMISNIILVIIFDFLKKKNKEMAILGASFLKFAFLFICSSYLFNLLWLGKISVPIVRMMSWPQLITALLGGILAIFFFKKK